MRTGGRSALIDGKAPDALTSHSNARGRDGQLFTGLGYLGRVALEDGTDHHQAKTHTESTEEEVLLSSCSFDTENHEESGGDDLDETVHTRGEQTGGRTSDTDRLEDIGSVVVDRVLTGPLLADEHEHGDDESLGVTLDFELADPTGTGGGRLFFLDSGDDFTEFGLHSTVVGRHVSNPGEVLESLGVSVLGSQPTGRLLDERNNGEHDGKRGELHGDGDLPDSGCSLEGWTDAGKVVDPVGEGDTNDDTDLEETGNVSSHVGGGQFGDVGGADRGFDTDTDTGEESTGVLVVEVHTSGLQDTLKDRIRTAPGFQDRATHSNHEDDTTDQQTLLSTNGVVHGSSAQGTEEGT